MSEKQNRRKGFFANSMHKEMFFLIFFAAVLPTLITTVFLYYLIFYITTEQIAIPEAIAYNIIPAAKRVTVILCVSLPFVIGIIMMMAFKITHRVVGPLIGSCGNWRHASVGKKPGLLSSGKRIDFGP